MSISMTFYIGSKCTVFLTFLAYLQTFHPLLPTPFQCNVMWCHVTWFDRWCEMWYNKVNVPQLILYRVNLISGECLYRTRTLNCWTLAGWLKHFSYTYILFDFLDMWIHHRLTIVEEAMECDLLLRIACHLVSLKGKKIIWSTRVLYLYKARWLQRKEWELKTIFR